MAVEDARSAATLGRARQGSGVVISEDGLLLTIGYLVPEAEQVKLVTDDARVVPARVVAYDLATGFGLVQALAPLRLSAVPLGFAAGIADEELLLIASGGEGGSLSAAKLMSRRGFSGYWKYHIDGALFTTPARSYHSGAGLFNQHGELVGIGSLFVADAMGPSAGRLPGNVFVPIDLLSKPAALPAKVRGRGSASTASNKAARCASFVSTRKARPKPPASRSATASCASMASKSSSSRRFGKRFGAALLPNAPWCWRSSAMAKRRIENSNTIFLPITGLARHLISLDDDFLELAATCKASTMPPSDCRPPQPHTAKRHGLGD